MLMRNIIKIKRGVLVIKKGFIKRGLALAVACVFAVSPMINFGANTAERPLSSAIARQAEYLDRGVVAILVEDGIMVQWRLRGFDPEGAMFNIYRDGVLITPQPVWLTNFIDENGTSESVYSIGMVVDGVEVDRSNEVSVWEEQFLQIYVGGSRPEATIPGTRFYINDASVGDLTGNGQLDIIFMWQPNNARDSAHDGRSDNSYITAFTLEGEHLWTIDIGPNIRSGQHDIQFLVYDFAGIGRAQLAVRTADGTVDGVGNVIGDPDAIWTHNPETGAYMNGGRNLQGPLFLSVFDGLTGAVLDTVPYIPQTNIRWYQYFEVYEEGHPALRRNPSDHAFWGDTQGNRSERYNAAVAYLNGTTPSMVFQRGYFGPRNVSGVGPGRVTVAAFDFSLENGIEHVWTFDTFCPYSPGMRHPENFVVIGKGNHNISVGDALGCGRDSIFLGSSAIRYDGTLLWANINGHGDAMHLGAFIPPESLGDFTAWCRETNSHVPLESNLQLFNALCDPNPLGGGVLVDAATGRTIYSPDGVRLHRESDRDSDRGIIGVFGEHGGYATMSAGGGVGSFNTLGETVTGVGANNFRIFWNGSLWDQPMNGINIYDQSEGRNTINFRMVGAAANNGSKATPMVTADIIGDWRENPVMRTPCNNYFRVYVTVDPTEHRLYTLMHDPLYRMGITWQNSSYNQPPRISFYLADRDGHRDLQPTANIFVPEQLSAATLDVRPSSGSAVTPMVLGVYTPAEPPPTVDETANDDEPEEYYSDEENDNNDEIYDEDADDNDGDGRMSTIVLIAIIAGGVILVGAIAAIVLMKKK